MKLEQLVTKIQSYLPGADVDLLRRAFEFSASSHKDQRRASGEPYVSHPLAVAKIIADLNLDLPSVITGLLHDTVEDTRATTEDITRQFGPEVATLVAGVTKIDKLAFDSNEEHRAENIRKMIIATSEDLRVILIKLADRLHNMRTLAGLPPDKQRNVAAETLDIYAPLAHRLGIYWMKSEMEDLALHALHPEIFYQLRRAVSKKQRERDKYIREVQTALSRQLDAAGLECEVQGRPKHFFSIYQKMRSQNLLYEQLYDLVAFRVVVDTTRECYEALGIVHGHWKPVPGRFKDYIAIPKGNGYQSLHTTVVGPAGERIEIQIRSSEMHRFAELGIAAHWGHKEGAIDQEEIERIQQLKQMFEWQRHVQDPKEFLDSFKEDLVPDEVYVFTPAGELLHFPAGATVVDFAYRIHSEVGHRCTGARVGGKLVPLRYALRNGDTVEIITTQHQQPSRDWLKMVATPRAKERIREWIKAEEARRSVEVGREILARDLAKFQLDLEKLSRNGRLDEVAHALGVEDWAELVAEVGYGKIVARQVVERLVPPEELDAPEPRDGPLARLFRAVAGRGAAAAIQVTGQPDVLVRMADCCEPLPGEDICGLMSIGHGVTVHAADCAKALDADPQRRVVCAWDRKAEMPRVVRLEVLCVDQPGLLAAMSSAITQSKVDIRNADARSIEDGKALNTFEVMVRDRGDLAKVQRNLERVKGVMRVERVRG